MPVPLPPLSGLRLFEAAARCGSFKAAAHELGLTPGAFTHAIDSLEQWLDVQLFERDARGVVLTAAGRQYLPYVTEALSMIVTGTLRLPTRRFRDRLSITSADLFAYKVLLPRLHKFREMHPDMVVTVDVRQQFVPLPSDEFDIAIRSGRESWSKLSCDLLGRVRISPVGAPHYVRSLMRGGALDWPRATLIHNVSVSDDWETWCNHSRTDTASARRLVVSTCQVAFQAAIDGLGLAIGRSPVIDEDIEAGRLVVALDHVVPVTTGYWLVKPAGTETRRKIVAFSNWLLEEMAQLRWNGHSEGRAASQSA
ncbi:MAG TPA: LysR substrate-binding domain-containing protein [Xanthobacteraceae bacterium]|nr:LysR substrate-binding domain-containing protein [Xanthobacteraceae bacterium]